MSSPQLETGYLKISNELFEAICKIRIPGEARQVFDVILRKTYGFNKKDDAISLSQFHLITGLRKSNIIRALKKLREINLISVIKKDKESIAIYRINKDFDSWKPLSKKIMLSKTITNVIKNDKNRYQKRDPQKTIIKDNITKDIQLEFKVAEIPFLEIKNLFNKICAGLPKIKSLSDSRKKSLKGIWKISGEYQNLEFWESFFQSINQSDFLSGRLPPSNGRSTPFKASFDWILNPKNFTKIDEGNFKNRGQKNAETHKDWAGDYQNQ